MAAGEDTPDVTLETLHGDLTDLKGDVSGLRGEVRAGFADLETTMITGFAGMPTRESSEEMIRLLRENNRLTGERFTHLEGQVAEGFTRLGVLMREQHVETQQTLGSLVHEIKRLVDSLVRR